MRSSKKPLTKIYAIVAVISIVFGLLWVKVPGIYSICSDQIEGQRTTALAITGAAAGISTALSLIPDDICTPVANEIANTCSFFLAIFCVLLLEDCLLTFGGSLSLILLFPAGFILLAINQITSGKCWKELAKKLFVIGIVLTFTVPLSLGASSLVGHVSQTSIQETIELSTDTTLAIEESRSDEDSNLLTGFLNKIKTGVTGVREQASDLLNRFIKATATLIVTDCVVPIISAAIFIGIVKTMFSKERE